MSLIQPWSWLYAVCFLDLLGASMIMPVFSTHLRSLGVSHSSVGILSSVYGATQLVSGPIIGSWSDIHGRRSILCLSMIVCALAYGFMSIVTSFYLFLFMRCFLGFFKHTQTLCRVYCSVIVPAKEQASVQGLMNAFTSFSFMIGPTISGHVMEVENGFQYLAVSVSLIFVLNSAIAFMFANTNVILTPKQNKTEDNNFFRKFSLVFKELYNIEWRHFWALFSIKFLFSLATLLFFQNMSLFLTENYEISPRYMGYTISFYGFISVICNLNTGWIKSLFLPSNYLKSLTVTSSVMTVTFFLLYTINSYFLFLVGLVPLAGSQAFTRILLTELLLEQSEDSHRGSMLGASSSIVSVGRIITPFIFGIISSWGGVSSALLVSSFAAGITCLLTQLVYSSQIYKSDVIMKKE